MSEGDDSEGLSGLGVCRGGFGLNELLGRSVSHCTQPPMKRHRNASRKTNRDASRKARAWLYGAAYRPTATTNSQNMPANVMEKLTTRPRLGLDAWTCPRRRYNSHKTAIAGTDKMAAPGRERTQPLLSEPEPNSPDARRKVATKGSANAAMVAIYALVGRLLTASAA